MRLPVNTSESQKGIALLAFMLILIIGSTYYLVTKLNANLQIATGEQKTREALLLAKQALIGYAVSYPEQINASDGPGYLPCPDTDKDGDAEGNCSLGGETFIGRLPYKTLEISRLRDASGQELWYALSENFRYGPNKTIPLNSESPTRAELSINGIGDIVAVIIAPNGPLNSQSRNPSENIIVNEIANYLDDDNANLDVSFVTRAPGDFNDVVTVITRDELMRAVERRVNADVARIMTEYNMNYGAYPWLTPFADPKSGQRVLKGVHTGGNGATSLIDSSRDFTEWGVSVGDEIRNITDGAIGAVTSVTATMLGVSGSMQLGIDNDFDNGDEYAINIESVADTFEGIATAGASGNALTDTGIDFRELDISTGDIIDNIDDGSSGMVEIVDSSSELTVKSLSGGTNNVFASGNNYRIRSNAGQATAGSNNQILVDADKDFIVKGVLTNDLVINLTDGSLGRINSVAVNTLTVDQLHFGSDNTFQINDYYSLPRFNTDSQSREGLLSFHQEGEFFSTAFNMDFNITANSTDVVFDAAAFPDASSGYRTALENHVVDYANSGAQSYNISQSACKWLIQEVADCYGGFDDYVNISGRVTSGNNTNIVADSAANFTLDGVQHGDIVQNFDDESSVITGIAGANSSGTILVDTGANFSIYEPYSYVIQNNTQETNLGVTKVQGIISNIIDANTIEIEPYLGESTTVIDFVPGDNYQIFAPRKLVVRDVNSSTNLTSTKIEATDPDFDTNEYYRVIPASTSTDGVVDSVGVCSASNTCQITDGDGDFLNKGVAIGDIIENQADSPSSYGEVTAVTATTVTTRLYGGTNNLFQPLNQFRIYSNHVYLRRHEIRPRFRGDLGISNSSGKRVRDLCLGYNSDCTSTAGSIAFSGNGGVPLITVRDYKEDGTTEVGRASFTPTASSNGTLRVSDIDYYFAENNGDLPAWFVKNNWHQLVTIGYSDADKPGAGSVCIVGTDCLTLTGAGAPDNNKRALVISASEELATQDRATGDINSYYEGDNNSMSDDAFQEQDFTGTFNDQVRVISTTP